MAILLGYNIYLTLLVKCKWSAKNIDWSKNNEEQTEVTIIMSEQTDYIK